MSCLNDALKRAEDKLQLPINQMNETIAQIKRQNQEYKKDLDRMLEEIRKNAHLLKGSPQSQGSSQRRALLKSFSPQCQEIMGKGRLHQAIKQEGLMGLGEMVGHLDGQAKEFSKAGRFNQHVEDIERQLKKLQRRIEKFGSEGQDLESLFKEEKDLGAKEYGSIVSVLKKEQAKLKKSNREDKINSK